MKKRLSGWFLGAVFCVGMGNPALHAQDGGLVVHEWGTFTSFQGGDGELLPWKPLETSHLPKFVHDWMHPGALPQKPDALLLDKGSLISLQRMETPVLYFYSGKAVTADVAVSFPKGLITEWFPAASEAGPGSLASIPVDGSSIRWANIQVMPAAAATAPVLATDDTGSHYFAARETDAAYVHPQSVPAETEKFLFYRGVANFATPLRVNMSIAPSITLANGGKEPLAGLFVLRVEPDSSGNCVYLPSLAPESKSPAEGMFTWQQNIRGEELGSRLAKEMSAALVKEGLYPREAEAMVNTWKDSWFQEPGLRVLYILPRAWTDATLPLKITPAPRELVRVMVGRADILSPVVEHDLASKFSKALEGDTQALTEARSTLKSFGRFSEPALNRTMAKSGLSPDQRVKLNVLLYPPPANADSLYR